MTQVPFRLTRMMINAMEVSGVEGNFRWVCPFTPVNSLVMQMC